MFQAPPAAAATANPPRIKNNCLVKRRPYVPLGATAEAGYWKYWQCSERMPPGPKSTEVHCKRVSTPHSRVSREPVNVRWRRLGWQVFGCLQKLVRALRKLRAKFTVIL